MRTLLPEFDAPSTVRERFSSPSRVAELGDAARRVLQHPTAGMS